VSDVRWEGLTHDEIYAAVHKGPGAAISKPAEDAWKETEALILRIDQRIASAMAGSQAGWEGGAADATRSAMTPLGQWALDAARNAKLTAGAVTGQGLMAKYVRDNMPEPVTEQRNAAIGNALTDPTFIFHGLDDLQAVEQDAANRAARAVELMNGYTDNSEGNRQFWGSSPFPPQVTVVTGAASTGAGGPGVPGIAGAPAPTPPADVAPPPPGGAPPVPPAAAPPTGVPPAPTPPIPPVGAPPDGPGAQPGPATPIAPAVVPPAPGQPPGANAPGPGALPTVPATPIAPGGTQPPGVVPPPPVVPPGRPSAIPPSRGVPPGGVRPVVPGAAPRTAPQPGWRDVIPRTPTAPGSGFPATGAPGSDRALPPGTRAAPEPPGARPAGEPTARAVATGAPAGTRPGVPAGLYPPLAAGLGAGSERERRRPEYLLDDSDAFVDDRWFTPAVITPDDGPPVGRGR
jgi:PPE family protein